MDVLLSVEVERASNCRARAELELLDEARTLQKSIPRAFSAKTVLIIKPRDLGFLKYKNLSILGAYSGSA